MKRKPYVMRKTPMMRFMEKIDTAGSCWIWLSAVNNKGYGFFHVRRPAGGSHVVLAHRFAYEAFVGSIRPTECVLHKCDVPRCVRPQHLFLGTVGDNNRDAWEKGRHNWRVRIEAGNHPANGHGKLTAAMIPAIRQAVRSGLTCAEVGRAYRVSGGAIQMVVRNKTWRHVVSADPDL